VRPQGLVVGLSTVVVSLAVTGSTQAIVVDPAPPSRTFVPLGGQLEFRWQLEPGETAAHVQVARTNEDGDEADWIGGMVFDSGPLFTESAVVTFDRPKWRSGAFYWDLCVVSIGLPPGVRCGRTQDERGLIVYDPTVPPKLEEPTFWLAAYGRPGPRYYVRANVRLQACSLTRPEPLTLIVSEQKRIGKRTLASRRWVRRVGTIDGCVGRTVSWKLGSRFYGIGKYTVTVRARNSYGLLSNAVKKSWFTRD
jgi:hypothetical protein